MADARNTEVDEKLGPVKFLNIFKGQITYMTILMKIKKMNVEGG
jgi:hypothetical protein